jgi:hypothetical protein
VGVFLLYPRLDPENGDDLLHALKYIRYYWNLSMFPSKEEFGSKGFSKLSAYLVKYLSHISIHIPPRTLTELEVQKRLEMLFGSPHEKLVRFTSTTYFHSTYSTANASWIKPSVNSLNPNTFRNLTYLKL